MGRALDQLGIEHIAAYSPEARGRSERMFGTLQERLPKFLREVYLPAQQRAFCQIATDRRERVRDARRSCTVGRYPVHRGGAGGGTR